MAQDLQVSSIEWRHAGHWSAMTWQAGFGAQCPFSMGNALYSDLDNVSCVRLGQIGIALFMSSLAPIGL